MNEATCTCPMCGNRDAVRYLDGDTINVSETIPAEGMGLCLKTANYSLFTTLHLGRCESCGSTCYLVELDAIANPNVNDDWCDKYFWRNEEIFEVAKAAAARPRLTIENVPDEWAVELTDTAAGVLQRHYFGPFVGGEELLGPYGVARCEGGDIWENAAQLLGRIWPLIASEQLVFSPKTRTSYAN